MQLPRTLPSIFFVLVAGVELERGWSELGLVLTSYQCYVIRMLKQRRGPLAQRYHIHFWSRNLPCEKLLARGRRTRSRANPRGSTQTVLVKRNIMHRSLKGPISNRSKSATVASLQVSTPSHCPNTARESR